MTKGRYDETFDMMRETLVRIDERQIALSNRLYDKDGDMPKIVKHLETLNCSVQKNATRISLQEQSMQGFPYNIFSKKWFWVLLAVIVMGIAGGMEYQNVYELLIKILG